VAERADDSLRWILQRTAKAALAGALCAAGARWAVNVWRRRLAGGGRVILLSYHRVTLDFRGDAQQSLASLLISAETLKIQLEQLARERDLVSLEDACRLLAERPPRRQARDAVAVTFDDGYQGCHDFGLPVLQALHAPATMFVPTGYLGTEHRLPHDRIYAALSELWRRGRRPREAELAPAPQAALDRCAGPGPATTLERLIAGEPHDVLLAVADALEARLGLREEDLEPGTRLMGWEEARALDAAGVRIGGHTVNHAVLANLPQARARAEIEGSHRQIEERLGHPPLHFAYPNGYHTPAVRRMVAEAGYLAAVTTEDLENRRGGDPFALRRKVLWENSTLGAAGYSRALAACNLDGVFGAMGLQPPVLGERPDGAEEAPDAVEDPGDAAALEDAPGEEGRAVS
jgi:peptidoglycan/xylan/chitin deacetylase (PgdA/CDA1 family)